MYIVIDADKFGAILDLCANAATLCACVSIGLLVTFIIYRFVILPRKA